MNFSSFDFSSDFLEFQRSVAFVNSAYKQTYGAQLWPAAGHLFSHPSLDKWTLSPSKDSWLCHSKWSAGLWKTFHELHKDLPKDTPSNHEVLSRLLWLLPKSCLSKRVRHRQRTLIASALAFSFGLWDYDIWPSAWEWGDNMLWIL